MTTPSLLEQAKDGDAAAIAALLTHALKPKGITVRGDRHSYCLQLWFSGCPAPPQPATVAYVRRTMEKLQPSVTGIVQLYGIQTGDAQPVWSEEIALLSLSSEASLSDESQFRETSTLPDEGRATTPDPQPSPFTAAPTPVAVVRAYEELGLSLGNPLPQVEAVYFKRRAELLRLGDRAALEPLKWAFTTLKTHLEQSAVAEADSASTTLLEAIPTTGIEPGRRSPLRQTKLQPNPPADDTDLLSFQNRYSNGLIFPGLLLLGVLMNAMPIVNALLFGIKIWLHEFGHATVAWLSGRQALPLPIGWTSYNPQRSGLVYLAILVLLGLLFWVGRREGQRWPMVLATVLAVVQFYMTWLLPAERFDMLMAFGGVGGEIYLSALLMVGFYFPLPHYFRWDFYRFPVVLGAAFCFWGQVWLWQQVPKGKASIPFGSLWGEAEHGDMNQLIDIHGWMPGNVIGTYGTLTHLCLLGIVGIYAYTLFCQHRQTFVALGRQWLP
ncbi:MULTISPECIES: hypothetical protein [Cyanophyceae]|uniref:hypothetical protein n=1 Tax=Cyanophyceae TaxID=3028117 RepID=UPI001684C083|nr:MULTISPECIES: hypothetical protein [Cyanophyceae]MBD1917838.1 hypothetical protein [Phormidium sp. FACHB-77]MBD2032956.1 hypothetical protein [Phormidium sp. FACHB-322]MBD2051704.1 hypothetical protein [Leptolyngbya sp. FACHB-60]